MDEIAMCEYNTAVMGDVKACANCNELFVQRSDGSPWCEECAELMARYEPRAEEAVQAYRRMQELGDGRQDAGLGLRPGVMLPGWLLWAGLMAIYGVAQWMAR